MWMDLFMVDVNTWLAKSGALKQFTTKRPRVLNVSRQPQGLIGFAGCSSTLLLVLIQLHRTFRSEIKTERHHWVAEYHERKHKKLKRYHRFLCVLQRDWQGD
ncbi:hypothetical protein HID58_015919 [Brassica napus]|uniref:Uncharacterized protein n=1 Tax=Brassica napus TaxID=3708 RepID=A0ABQ8DLE9_BRANA|nr:hypothetical protein HID58_015919 [Brassica napus]